MIKTTVVGSYPVPVWLQALSTREALRDAMLAVLKTQELAGIDVVADGELYRWDVNHAETNGMIDYFLRPMSGVDTDLTFEQLTQWHSERGHQFRAKPPGIINQPLGHGTMDLKSDYELFSGLTTLPRKFTVTSPFMLAKTVGDNVYESLHDRVMAIADILKEQVERIDAEVIQVDEANVTGHPEEGGIAAAGINRVLEGIKTESGVHLCYGNYGGQVIQKGTYEKLLDFINSLRCDHVVLELARRPKVEIELLKDVKPEIGLGVGVIDIKDNEIETPEKVARRIERICEVVSPERVAYVHPDCGFWMLPRSVADGKIEALVKGRDQFLGRG